MNPAPNLKAAAGPRLAATHRLLQAAACMARLACRTARLHASVFVPNPLIRYVPLQHCSEHQCVHALLECRLAVAQPELLGPSCSGGW
jgi:hypothetical protein